MAKKKKKSVLNYDPLAWLNDSDAEESVEVKMEHKKGTEPQNTEKETETKADKTKTKKKMAKKKVFKKKKSAKDFNNDETSDVDGFGFFTNDEALDVVNTETLNITKDDVINLGSELTLKTVSEIKIHIDDMLTKDEDIVINAEEMIKIDTAGLQLLYSLKETLSQTGHHIKWVGTSSVINDSAKMIGMPILAPKSKEACFGFF